MTYVRNSRITFLFTSRLLTPLFVSWIYTTKYSWNSSFNDNVYGNVVGPLAVMSGGLTAREDLIRVRTVFYQLVYC